MTTTLKTCFKCLVQQPVDNFYRHKMMTDGLLGKCKDCARKDVTENRAKRADYYREFDRTRYRSLSIDEIRNRNARSRARGNLARDKSGKQRKPADEKQMARNILARAIRAGKISRPSACWHCGIQGAIHGHHSAYDLPLAVTWLCSICHGLAHRVTNDCIREAEMASNKQIAA